MADKLVLAQVIKGDMNSFIDITKGIVLILTVIAAIIALIKVLKFHQFRSIISLDISTSVKTMSGKKRVLIHFSVSNIGNVMVYHNLVSRDKWEPLKRLPFKAKPRGKNDPIGCWIDIYEFPADSNKLGYDMFCKRNPKEHVSEIANFKGIQPKEVVTGDYVYTTDHDGYLGIGLIYKGVLDYQHWECHRIISLIEM